jgi:hypothetical protein
MPAIAWPSGSESAALAGARAGAGAATRAGAVAGASAFRVAFSASWRFASRAASRLLYIGLLGSVACPGAGSAGRPALAVFSVKGEAPLVIASATATAMARPTIRPMMTPVRVLPRWRCREKERE